MFLQSHSKATTLQHTCKIFRILLACKTYFVGFKFQWTPHAKWSAVVLRSHYWRYNKLMSAIVIFQLFKECRMFCTGRLYLILIWKPHCDYIKFCYFNLYSYLHCSFKKIFTVNKRFGFIISKHNISIAY